MIYINTTQVLNGTVTMSVHTVGFEAESFFEAVQKLKDLNKNIEISTENENTLSYLIPQNDELFKFTVWGHMDNEPLKIY
jgi:hypothetical protein